MVDRKGPNLMGRDWLAKVKVMPQIHSLSDHTPLKEVLSQHATVFNNELVCFNGPLVQLMVRENAKPIFHKARPIPFILKKKVECELEGLQGLGIISPVPYSSWSATIVPVEKQDGSVKICGDFKVTVLDLT